MFAVLPRRFVSMTILVGMLLPTATAMASAFQDVPKDHPYATEIYELQRLGIFTGDTKQDGTPKGTARPEDPLQRDELLALVYRAAGKEVRNIYNNCFPDVVGLWSESVVCTAKENKDIQGYPDGTFRPAQAVNHVEALKIILTTLGFTVPTMTLENQVGIDYKNVNVKSWYAPYLLLASRFNLLPAALTAENDFYPDAPTTRGEAAYLLAHALNIPVEDRTRLPETVGAASTSSSSVDNEETMPTGATLVAFPLHRTEKTGDRGSAAFVFDLAEPGTVLMEARNNTSTASGIDCYLYLLGASGFSNEFFIGYREGASCSIRAALRAGRYQVEVRTRSEGAEFSLDLEPSSDGDGNDGFIEAVALRVGAPRNGTLASGDFEDWYRFRVDAAEPHRLSLSSPHDLACSIYPAEDVDLFGFEGPSCDKTEDYATGTYYVSLKKKSDIATTQTYTVELR